MNMCQAFAHQGHEVTLFGETVHRDSRRNIFDFYGVSPSFSIKSIYRPYLPVISGLFFGFVQSFRARFFNHSDIAYARCIYSSFFALIFGMKLIIEFHEMPYNIIQRFLYWFIVSNPNTIQIVTISQGLEKDLLALFPNIDTEKCLVAHDGANSVAKFASSSSILVNKMGLCIGYAGGIRAGNGIEMILRIASTFKEDSFHIAGGTQEQISYWQARSPGNVHWYGLQNPSRIPCFLQGCDLLLAPYQAGPKTEGGKDTISWMSPMKLFEYMAAGKGIIISDFPVIREVLNGDCAELVAPDDFNAWCAALRRMKSDSYRQKLGTAALNVFESKYSWSARAKIIFEKASAILHCPR